jgi:hypothetical protein
MDPETRVVLANAPGVERGNALVTTTPAAGTSLMTTISLMSTVAVTVLSKAGGSRVAACWPNSSGITGWQPARRKTMIAKNIPNGPTRRTAAKEQNRIDWCMMRCCT